MRSTAPVLKPLVDALNHKRNYFHQGAYVPTYEIKCHVCGDFASHQVTFYRRNPRNRLVMRPYRQFRCERHLPKEK